MKKILAWVLVLVTVLGLFAGCKKDEPAPTESVSEEVITAQDAIEYLKALYPKAEEATKTPVNYDRMGIIRIGGIPFTVVWTTDLPEEQIKILVSEDGATVTIDVNEQCEVDTPYVLTATITDEQGNTASTSWNCVLPQAVDMVSIVEEAYALKSGESLPYESTLRGKIVSIDTVWNPEYQNITVTIAVEGAEDKPIQCYRLKGDGADKLAVGNIITVTGTLKNYNGTIEFDAGCMLDAVEQGDAVEAPTDPGEILKAAYKLKKGKSLPYPVTLTGKVTSIDKPFDPAYNNISVVITVDGYKKYPILCYRLKGTGAEDIALEDTITVTGIIKNYEGTIEFDAGCQLVERISGGNTAQKPTDDEAKILRDAKKLKNGEKLPYVAILTGQVFSVDDKYDSEYKNITVTMKVSGTRIKAYRLKGDDVQKVKVGDTITVSGQIENYQGVLEFGSGCTMTDRRAGSGKLKVELGPVENGQVYYAEMKQATLGKNLYFNGKISSSNYLQTTEDPAQAVMIHVEEVSGKGTRFYFLEGETKKYIEIMTVEVSGEKKQRTTLVTEPTAYWNYDSEYKVYFFDADGVYCALGTYSTNNSISATKLGFLSTSNIGKSQFVVKYVTEPSEAPEKPDAPVSDGTIAAAVAGNDGELFTVTGVITLVDGSNVYLQDATGGICVRFPSRIEGFQLGHVIKATGTRATYNTLPQLAEATYEVASGIELVAKETTIGALTTADICTYIKLTGVTVTEVYDNNGTYTSPNITVKDSSGKTIQLYKAVVGKTGGNWDVKVGDKLNVYAAVSVHNNKLQLRNTYATEIAIDPAQPVLHTPTVPAPVPEGSDDPVTPPPATGESVLELTTDSLGLANETYYTGAATVSGIELDLTQIGNYGAGIQMRDKEGKTSILFNKNALSGKITRIELTFNSGKKTYDNADSVIFSFGAAQDNLTYTTKLSTVADQKNYTVTPVGDFTFFKIEHDVGYSYYWDSIKIYYEGDGTTPEQPPIDPEPEQPGASVDLNTGDQVVIFAPAYNKALSSETAAQYYQAGIDVTVTDGTVTGYGATSTWTVTKNPDGSYSFAQNGQNIALAAEYSSMKLGEANDDWTLESLGGTLFNIKNTVRGNYIEWYASKDNWSTYAASNAATDDQFQLSIYVIGKGLLGAETSEPEQPPVDPEQPGASVELNTGDQVVIFAPAYNKALSSETAAQYYQAGIDVTVTDGEVTGYGATSTWTVTKNPDGSYSFAQNGQNIALAAEYSSMKLGEANDDWTLESLGGTLFNIKNTVRGNYMEWYASKDNWSTYAASNAATDDQFQLSIYVIGKGLLGAGTTDPELPPAGDPDGTVLTIPEAVAMGSAMENKTFTTTKYVVTGVVDELVSTDYGNMYIKDANGNRLYVYGVYDITGANRYDALTTKPVVGDTITLLGVVGNYNGAQMKSGWLQELIPGSGSTPDQPPVTPSEAAIIDRVAVLTAGTYKMAAYLTKNSNNQSLEAAPYHLWTGTVSGSSPATGNSDLKTSSYSFEDNTLTAAGTDNAADVKLVAVSGKENTYYIMVGDMYLYSAVAATNRRMSLGTEPAEWVATNNANGGITLSSNDVYLGSASALSNYLRSYKGENSLKYGVVFFPVS